MKKSEEVDSKKLVDIAKVLGVSVESIENFPQESTFSFFNNYYDNSGSQNAYGNGINFTFNPLDKLIEAYDENKKLYERLVQVEKDKNEYLEKVLNEK